MDAETSIKRAVARDATNGLADADLVRQKYDRRYEPAWRIYEGSDDPDTKADVIVDNTDVVQPRLLKGGPKPFVELTGG